MKRLFPICSGILMLTAFSGCAPLNSGGSGESLSQQVSRHERQIQTMMSQVGQVEQVLPGQAEMWAQMQSMRQELNTLHGQVDNISNDLGGTGGGEMGTLKIRVERLEAAVRQIASQMGINVSALDAPLPEPTSGQNQSPATGALSPAEAALHQNTQPIQGDTSYETSPVMGSEPAPAATTPAANTDTANTVYESGIKAFDQRNYKQAVAIFKDFTNSYPKHTLASNATFWEGESYYQMKDYGRAALAYQDVIEKYPGSNKFQSAMLKQGMALHMAGKKDAGKQRLEELVKRYPNSPEATRAKQFMQTNK